MSEAIFHPARCDARHRQPELVTLLSRPEHLRAQIAHIEVGDAGRGRSASTGVTHG